MEMKQCANKLPVVRHTPAAFMPCGLFAFWVLCVFFRLEGLFVSLISVNDLTFCYDGSYDNIFEHVSFEIDTDWRLGFVGRNGRGKTTFLNLLLGAYEYSGSIRASVRFTYFPFVVSLDYLRPIDKQALFY